MVPRLRIVACTLVVVTGLLGGCGGGDASSGKAPQAGTSTPTEATGSAKYQPRPADFRAVARVLAHRAKAVREDDEHEFLATVDGSNHALVARQRTLFANMSALSIASLHYEMDRSAALVPAEIAGHDPVLHPQITEFLRLAGSLDRPVTNGIEATFVKRGDGWVVGADTSGTATDADAQWRPWGGPPIAVLRRGTTTALVDGSRASTLPPLMQEIRDDIAFDAGQLGVPASYKLVVDATTTGSSTSFSSLSKEEAAAVTFALVSGTRESPTVGGRLAGIAIKVNPRDAGTNASNTPLLRHELTHYLLRPFNGAVPKWLSEGIATWIQYYPDDFGVLGVSPALYDRVMHADRDLPSVGLFNDDPEVNYLVSQAAVTWLVSQFGMSRLIDLMRAYRDNFRDVNVDALTPRMLGEEYGVTEKQVVAGAWELIASLHH